MQQPARCLILLLTLAAMPPACAARRTPPVVTAQGAPVPPAPSTPAIDVEALIAQGCFSCLRRAFDTARAQGDSRLSFEAAVLLTLRAKELGFPHDEWIAHARTLAGDDGGLRLIVEMADAVPVDALAGNRDATLSQTPQRIRADQRLAEWLMALKDPPGSIALRTYVHLALSCASDAVTKPDEIAADIAEGVRELPVIRYR